MSFTSFRAILFTSFNNLSPKPVANVHQQGSNMTFFSQGNIPRHSVDPPLRMILPYKLFRRSKSVRLRESTTTCSEERQWSSHLVITLQKMSYLMHSRIFHANEFRVEQNFWGPISFAPQLKNANHPIQLDKRNLQSARYQYPPE